MMKNQTKNNLKVIVPPLKSQGIKTKLVPWINDLVEIANVSGKWVEPFLGTGVVGFNAGFKEALLSDTNIHIIELYKSIQNKTITPQIVREYLECEGAKLKVSEENGYVHFRHVRDRFNTDFSPLDLLFLSRAGFNGMMRFSSKGKWNIPFCKKPNRFAQSYITKIVNQVENVSNVITDKWIFECKNFQEIIPKAGENDIIYCDPPYYGRYVDYYNGWDEKDEERLFELLSKTKAKFILSTWHSNNWRSNEMIDKYWKNFNIITKDHFYHSGGKIENRQSVVEALVCNFEVTSIAKHNHKSTNKLELQLE